MSERQQNPDELGALWVKTGGKGEYMTGTINGVPVVCFPNKSDNPKAPAWRVLKSKPKDAKPTGMAWEGKPVEDSEIPFAALMPLVLPALGLMGYLA